MYFLMTRLFMYSQYGSITIYSAKVIPLDKTRYSTFYIVSHSPPKNLYGLSSKVMALVDDMYCLQKKQVKSCLIT